MSLSSPWPKLTITPFAFLVETVVVRLSRADLQQLNLGYDVQYGSQAPLPALYIMVLDEDE